MSHKIHVSPIYAVNQRCSGNSCGHEISMLYFNIICIQGKIIEKCYKFPFYITNIFHTAICIKIKFILQTPKELIRSFKGVHSTNYSSLNAFLLVPYKVQYQLRKILEQLVYLTIHSRITNIRGRFSALLQLIFFPFPICVTVHLIKTVPVELTAHITLV